MIKYNTYLNDNLKENRIVRWPDKLMPLKVYVAPFTWYDKKVQQDSKLYDLYVREALQAWSQSSGGKLKFTLTNKHMDSNINLLWRRVDRKSLGMCYTDYNDCMIYSAEIEIGISDGILFSKYMDTSEVKHTIIHEIGHAIGLPHSPYSDDIMYVPHQYGVAEPTERDLNSAKWLYQFDIGYNVSNFALKQGFDSNLSLDETILAIENPEAYESFQTKPNQEVIQENNLPQLDIVEQQDLLAMKNKFNLSLQNIKIDINSKKNNLKKNQPKDRKSPFEY